MASPAVKAELLEAVDGLRGEEQQQVLQFARSLHERKVRGTPPEKVLELAGGIESDDLARMKDAIERGCERIDPDEW